MLGLVVIIKKRLQICMISCDQFVLAVFIKQAKTMQMDLKYQQDCSTGIY